jgi:lipoate synthase
MLFTSESCNLQCSYCDMANHINKKLHAEETKKVKESLVNG